MNEFGLPDHSHGILKVVTGCNDCPFYRWHDAGCGGDCRLVPIGKDAFKEMEHDEYRFNPVTPEWCPLKSEFVLVEFKK
jgi:hypothetical protein